MPEVRWARLRVRNELRLRKFSRSEQNVRLSIGQSHLATTGGSRADKEIADHWEDRFARALHFAQRQAVQSVSRANRQKRCGLRIRKARGQGKKRTEAQRAGR